MPNTKKFDLQNYRYHRESVILSLKIFSNPGLFIHKFATGPLPKPDLPPLHSPVIHSLSSKAKIDLHTLLDLFSDPVSFINF